MRLMAITYSGLWDNSGSSLKCDPFKLYVAIDYSIHTPLAKR